MSQRICSIDGCGRPHDSKGYCSTHAGRERSGRPLLNPCLTCGQDMRSTASRKKYCSDACRPTCSEADCARPARTRGLCTSHYSDLLAFERTGKPRAYRWATEKRCLVCGSTNWSGTRRKVCPGACQQILSRNGGEVPPDVIECQRCGGAIDLTVRGKAGRKKRSDTKMCVWCKKARHLRHHVSVTELVAAAGSTDCGICSEPVDMTLRHPDIFRASVDHILPFAHGGTHEMSNLQLAHLYCNYLKSDRERFTI